MTNVRQSLVQELRDAVLAVFSDARVYWLGANPSSPPDRYLVVSQISAEHVRHFGGGVGLVNPRYQIDCIARRPDDSYALAEAVRERLDNRRGKVGNPGQLTFFNGSFLESEREVFDQPSDGSQSGWSRLVLDFMLWHGETMTPIPA